PAAFGTCPVLRRERGVAGAVLLHRDAQPVARGWALGHLEADRAPPSDTRLASLRGPRHHEALTRRRSPRRLSVPPGGIPISPTFDGLAGAHAPGSAAVLSALHRSPGGVSPGPPGCRRSWRRTPVELDRPSGGARPGDSRFARARR